MEQLKLTEIQRDTLVFIRSYTKGNGYPPTLREMAKEFEVTPRLPSVTDFSF